jgi:putative ABC transport system permease protein
VERRAFLRALEERLAARPGVESVTLATQLPMIRYRGSRHVEIEGMQVEGRGDVPEHYADFVTPGFFSTFQSPVLHGRGFTDADDETAEPVALVNEPFARRYFGREVPIGRRIRIWSGSEPGPWRTVIGIAPHLWMDTDVNRSPEGVYVPMGQAPQAWAQIALRVSGDPASYAPVLREVVARIDPDIPVLDAQTMSELIRIRTRFYRFQSPPFIAVGLAALLLAMVGLYGVVSYLASLRRAEFGIRAVVGARRPELVRRSVGSVLPSTVVGAGIGLGSGLLLVRGFERWLFLVEPWNPWVVAATLSILGLFTALAALGPALRASRVDPIHVLRVD